jgi:hypothetical protein
MTHRPSILINLKIITTVIRLVAEKVNRRIVHTIGQVLVGLDVTQTVRLVPAGREDVEGDLAADGVCEADVGEGFFELADHGGAYVVLFVVGFVFVAFVARGVAADGRYVDHAVAELDEGAAFDGDVEVGDVVQDPVCFCQSYFFLDPTLRARLQLNAMGSSVMQGTRTTSPTPCTSPLQSNQ